MGTFLVYIIKSAVCLALLFAGYHWLLRRETFHQSNRIALLGMVFLSFLLPGLGTLCVIENTPETELSVWSVLAVSEIPVQVMTEVAPAVSSFDWPLGILVIYLLGVIILLVKAMVGLFQLGQMLRCGERRLLSDGVWLVLHHRSVTPFSWMNHIVMSEEDFNRHGAFIIAHERGHIQRHHSWDLLGVGLCAVLQWFNPFIWLLKRELHDVHEYEADRAVILQGLDRKQYQLLLIEKAVGTRHYSMANSFNHSSLKKRITMMKKEKSSPWARAKYLYVLPFAAVAVTAFARQEIATPLSGISDAKITDLAVMMKTKEAEKDWKAVSDTVVPTKDSRPVYNVVEQMAEFPGGPGALQKYLLKSVKYPQEAQENGQTGRVVVRFTIEQDGTVANPKVVRSAAPLLDAEVLRVVKQMPRWIPGKQRGKAVDVYHAIPVSFFLDGVTTSANVDENEVIVMGYSKTAKPEIQEDKTPLFILDGKEISQEVFNKLDPMTIASITLMKEDAAQKIHGSKAKNGAVVIATKRKNESLTVWKGKDDVLILCDGNQISGDVLQALSPDKIKSIEVLKDSVSRAKYQAADKEGVILIELKK